METMDLATFISERRPDKQLELRLLRLEKEAPQTLASLLSQLKPSANTLRDIMRFAEEVAQRDSCSLESVFAEQKVSAVLDSEKLNRSEKTKQLRASLESRRYPEKAALLESLMQARGVLLKETGLRFELPEDLEGDQLKLALKVRSASQLKELSDSLVKASEHPAFEEIVTTLSGEY